MFDSKKEMFWCFIIVFVIPIILLYPQIYLGIGPLAADMETTSDKVGLLFIVAPLMTIGSLLFVIPAFMWFPLLLAGISAWVEVITGKCMNGCMDLFMGLGFICAFVLLYLFGKDSFK